MSRRNLSLTPTDPAEAYADAFALNLLMPENEVRRLYREGVGWAGILVFFGVPQEIVIRRLRDLGLKVRT